MWLMNTTLRTGSYSTDSGKMVYSIIFVVSSVSICMVFLAIVALDFETRRKSVVAMLICV